MHMTSILLHWLHFLFLFFFPSFLFVIIVIFSLLLQWIAEMPMPVTGHVLHSRCFVVVAL